MTVIERSRSSAEASEVAWPVLEAPSHLRLLAFTQADGLSEHPLHFGCQSTFRHLEAELEIKVCAVELRACPGAAPCSSSMGYHVSPMLINTAISGSCCPSRSQRSSSPRR